IVRRSGYGRGMRETDRPEAEARAIAEFRWWRLVMLAGFFGVIPSVAILESVGVVLPLAALPAMLATGVGGVRAYRFRCPRCGRTFVFSWRWQNVLTDR